jgi:hypothetical protein
MQMFGKAKAERKRLEADSEAKAAHDVHTAELEQFLSEAREFRGVSTSEVHSPVLLKADERTFLQVEGVFLVEPRSGGGHWAGGSQGVSVHIPGTKSMRYRIGQTKGTYVQNDPKLTVIDTGSAVVTDKRVVFSGPKYTREWLWSKCIALDHQDDLAYTVIGVSNRQKTSGLGYDHTATPMVRFRLDLALAVENGTTSSLVAELSDELAQLQPPSAPPPASAWPPPSVPS